MRLTARRGCRRSESPPDRREQGVKPTSQLTDEMAVGPRASEVRRRDVLFVAFVAGGTTIAFFAAAGSTNGISRLLGAPALALLATAALAVGIARWKPDSARAWWWIGTGLALAFFGEITSWGYERLGSSAFPSMADALHLAAYPAFVAGLLTLAASSRTVRDRSAILDAWIIAAAAALILWLVLMDAYASGSGLTSAQRAFAIAYPAGDVLLLALAVRLLFAFRTRSPANLLLFGAVGSMLIGDVLFALGDLRLGAAHGGVANACILISYVLLGAAGLHRSVAAPVEPADAEVTVRPTRLVLLILAALVPPMLAIANEVGWWRQPDAIFSVAIATIVVSTLVIVRMWALTRVERAGVELRGRNRFESMIAHSQDVVAVAQPDGILEYLSPASTLQWGFEPETRVGTRLSVLVPSDDRARLNEHLTLAAALPRAGNHEFDLRLRRQDGIVRENEVVATNLIGETGINGLVITFHDVTEQKKLERELQHQAFHDSLTELANRALFFDRVEHALVRHRRDLLGKVAVLFIDLDDFKSVNDGLGHRFGDELLIAVGERLRECLRPGDTAARLGGDEFAVLLEDQADLEDAKRVAQRLLEVLQLPASVGTLELAVPASIGIAVAEIGTTPQDLLRDADIAMYTAKAKGKGRYEVFDSSMRVRATQRLEFRAELSGALERDELHLDYQPIIDVATGRIVSVEALLRWHHPERGIIPPLEFIPFAEESGLIVPIGRWVIETACHEAATWQSVAGWPVAVAVNVSGTQLSDPELVPHVRGALERSGLAPESLVLELTETVLMEDTVQTIRVLEALKEIGVRISVDDFGTGYCSLAYLRRFPVDDVKIDRTFIDELGRVPTSSTLASSIVTLADSLGVSAVAEGVETEEQIAILRDLDCELAQGFLFSRPVDAARLGRILAEGLPAARPRTAPGSDQITAR
jgi:diguanylate cyclase (GGDEF)-like protein/PAS domain S-box-containing protein